MDRHSNTSAEPGSSVCLTSRSPWRTDGGNVPSSSSVATRKWPPSSSTLHRYSWPIFAGSGCVRIFSRTLMAVSRARPPWNTVTATTSHSPVRPTVSATKPGWALRGGADLAARAVVHFRARILHRPDVDMCLHAGDQAVRRVRLGNVGRPNSLRSSIFAHSSRCLSDEDSDRPARLMYRLSIDMAD
jgi:hypothetical protein